MKRWKMSMAEALLAKGVSSLVTHEAQTRVAAIQTAEALCIAETLERALNNRSAVMEAIARRKTEIGVAEDADADAPLLQGTVRVRQSGGTYVAHVRVGDRCLYKASCTMGADQAAQSLAAKVQAARCATRVTLSGRLIGLSRVRGRPDEDQYLLSIYDV
jgi:hypothetical protein